MSVITNKLDRALQRINEATTPGAPARKTEQDLEWLTGFNVPAGTMIAHPIDRRTGTNKDPDGNPIPPWSLEELATAMEPLVRKIAGSHARRIGREDLSKGGREGSQKVNELAQNGFMALIDALRRGLDQGRPENKWTSWASRIIQSGIRGGRPLAFGGGEEERRARGRVGDLLSAKTPEQVQQVLNMIPAKHRTAHPEIAYTPTKGGDNPLGRYAPEIYRLANDLMTAMQTGDPGRIEAVQNRTRQYQQSLQDASEIRISGAATGVYDPWEVPAGMKTDKLRAGRRKGEGLTTTGQGGEEIENPGLPASKTGNHIKGIADREILGRVLDAGLRGMTLPDGRKIQLSTNEFRSLIRLFGLSDYPGKGTENDPEFDSSTGEYSNWAKNGYQPIPAQEIAADLGVGQTRIAQLVSHGPLLQRKQIYDPKADKGKGKMVTKTGGAVPKTGSVTADNPKGTPARDWGGSAILKLREIADNLTSDEDLEEDKNRASLFNALYGIWTITEAFMDEMPLIERKDRVDYDAYSNVSRRIKQALLAQVYDRSLPN